MDEDIKINFKDTTINDNLEYEKIKIAAEDGVSLEEWVIPSEFGIILNDHDSHGLIKFWKNKSAVLTFYESSFESDSVPTDIIFLYEFLKEKGWELIIDSDLRESYPEYWDKFYSAIYEININDVADGIKDDDSIDFVEYEKKIKEFNRTILNSKNRIGLLDLKEFENHKYDLEKRKKKESENLF